MRRSSTSSRPKRSATCSTSALTRIDRADPAAPVAAEAQPLVDGERDGLERREIAEQLVDLEGAHQAAAHPRLGPEPRDVLARQQDSAGGGRQHAGQQVDEGRLAGAVRPDQRLARAALEAEGDVVGGDDAAEALAEAQGFERGAHRRTTRASKPRIPPPIRG